MKKFICVIPRQKAGDLSNVRYQAQGNRALDYPGTARFPVIPLIWGYGQEGEEIRVIALSADYDNCRGNLELLEEELEALRKDRGLSCPKGVEVVEVPFDESLDSHIATFQKLIDRTEDGDDLYGLSYLRKQAHPAGGGDGHAVCLPDPQGCDHHLRGVRPDGPQRPAPGGKAL